jgi:hypothetical protein
MAMAQDSSHPTGVSDDSAGGSALSRARDRKANAALELVVDQGSSWIEVAEVLGYPTARAAKVAVEQALEKNLQTADREHLRRFVSVKLDRLLRSVWSKATNEEDPDQLAAVTVARGLMQDSVKLWGLAAPSEVVISSPSEREIETWVAQVHAQSMPQLEEGDIFEAEIVEDVDAVPAE